MITYRDRGRGSAQPPQHLSLQAIEQILSQIPAGVIVVEAPSGRILLRSAEAERLWRRPVRPGQTIWRCLHGLIRHLDGRVYALRDLPIVRAIRSGAITIGEDVQLQRGDGTTAIASVSAAPVRDARGTIVAGVATYTDVTTQRRAEADLHGMREYLQSLIDSVDGIVWEVDVATFRFTFVSEQAVRLLGYPLTEWYGERFWERILHPDDRKAAVDFCMERTRRMEAHDFEYRVLAQDGRVVWLRDLVSVVVSGGRSEKLRGIMVDVTAAKRAEAEAQDAIRVRDEFLSVASHELYTPLTSIQLAVQSVTSGAVGASSESLMRVFKVVERQARRLTRLVTELLDVTRFQDGRLPLRLEEVNLVSVAQEMADHLGQDLARSGSTLTIHATDPIRGTWDRMRLEQVVANLLANAIKFGRGGPIDLALEEEDGVATLSIRDRGIGIAPERLPRVFERFERAVSTREFGGLGLGLYIARTIVEALGGTIRSDSELGVGSTFTIRLPLAGPDRP